MFFLSAGTHPERGERMERKRGRARDLGQAGSDTGNGRSLRRENEPRLRPFSLKPPGSTLTQASGDAIPPAAFTVPRSFTVAKEKVEGGGRRGHSCFRATVTKCESWLWDSKLGSHALGQCLYMEAEFMRRLQTSTGSCSVYVTGAQIAGGGGSATRSSH